MQFIKPDINLDFIGKRKIAFAFSILLLIVTAVSLVMHNGLKLGVDFAGGTDIQVQFSGPVKIDSVKKALLGVGIEISTVQGFGDPSKNEFLVHMNETIDPESNILEQLKSSFNNTTGVDSNIRRVDMVGPKVGADLREKALYAMFYALLFITIYISWRFEQKLIESAIVAGVLFGGVYAMSLVTTSVPYLMGAALVVSMVLFWKLELKYAMGAIVALIHDVTITVGIFSLIDKEFSLPIVAALLTIIGYSLNDTIIVYDRVRENLYKHNRNEFGHIINRSLNETLSRTVLTSLTTMLVLGCLFVLGGGIIHDFSFAMIIGVLIGTYSSIFVASPILLAWQEKNNK